MWEPITVEALEEIVARQLDACTGDQRAAFAAYRVPFYPVPLHRFGGREEALVVAVLPQGLLYFEDVEEGFEIGVLGEDGALPDQGCGQFEITHILYQLGI